jgi:hypothetical protein
VRDPRALGVHHFAFLRSSLYGIDLRVAFARYLEWSETTTDLRHIERRRTELMRQVIDAGRHLDATLPPESKVTNLLELLRSDTPTPAGKNLMELIHRTARRGQHDHGYVHVDANLAAAFNSIAIRDWNP